MGQFSELQKLRAALQKLSTQLKSHRAHTYASENADHYRGFDDGCARSAEAIDAVLKGSKTAFDMLDDLENNKRAGKK